MITLEQLVRIVETGKAGVKLRRIGRERWEGLCPFHSEKTPSFQVWHSRATGKARYHCQGACKADGDAIDWLMKVEGKTFQEATGGVWKPDPQVARARARERSLEAARQSLLDLCPDLPSEAQAFADFDPLANLQYRLRRHLSGGQQ